MVDIDGIADYLEEAEETFAQRDLNHQKHPGLWYQLSSTHTHLVG